jgi:tetratricopeptide (TPR) repeat protein
MSKQQEADRLGRLADQHFESGALHKARSAYCEAIACVTELGNISDEAIYLGNLGVVHLCLGDPHGAVPILRRALALAKQTSNENHQDHVIDKLGVAYHQVGLHGEAVMLLSEALERAHGRGDKDREETLSGHLGNVFSEEGAFDKAAPHYERALQNARETGNSRSEGLWLANLGNNYLGLQEYERARECYEQALTISVSVDDDELRQRCRHGIEAVQMKLAVRQSPQTRKDPALVPGAFVFNALSARISRVADIGSKREIALSEKPLIDAAIQESLVQDPPEWALALIDSSKSLIGRELIARNRARVAGLNRPDIVIGGFNPSQVLCSISEEPNVATISFYYTTDRSFYIFVGFVKDGAPKVEKIVLASGNAGRNLYDWLMKMSDIKKRDPFNHLDEIVVNLLHTIGEAIIPLLQKLPWIRRILLVPYKLLYILPLHAMFWRSATEFVFLDNIGFVNYSNSMFTYRYHGMLRGGIRPPKLAFGLHHVASRGGFGGHGEHLSRRRNCGENAAACHPSVTAI